jgi:hypothetical protein
VFVSPHLILLYTPLDKKRSREHSGEYLLHEAGASHASFSSTLAHPEVQKMTEQLSVACV